MIFGLKWLQIAASFYSSQWRGFKNRQLLWAKNSWRFCWISSRLYYFNK